MFQRVHESTVTTDITALTPGDITPSAKEVLHNCPWDTIISNAIDKHTDPQKPLVIPDLPSLYRLLQATCGEIALVWFQEKKSGDLFEENTYLIEAVTYWTPYNHTSHNVKRNKSINGYNTTYSITVQRNNNNTDTTRVNGESITYGYTAHDVNPENVYGSPLKDYESETPALISISELQQSSIDVSKTQLTGYQSVRTESAYLDAVCEQSVPIKTDEDITCAVTECGNRVIERCPWTRFVQRMVSYMHAPAMDSYKPSKETLNGLLRATGGQLVLLWYNVEDGTTNSIDRISHVTKANPGLEVVTRNSRMVLTSASSESTPYPSTIGDLTETIAGENYAPVIAHISVLEELRNNECNDTIHAFNVHTSSHN